MGIELGKILAKNILGQLEKPEDVKGHDSLVVVILTTLPSYLCNVVSPMFL